MKVYIDIIFLINFLFDSLILFSVSIVLKRNIKIKRILLGGIIGGLSIFTLFISVSSLTLSLIKLFIMFLISIITFGYKDIKYTFYNMLYFFLINIIYGGFLYFLNIEFNNLGFDSKNVNELKYLFLVIISPIIIYIYTKVSLRLKYEYSLMKKVDVYLKNGDVIRLNGYLDTANKLRDPYKKRMVFITNSKKILKNMNSSNTVLVPYETIDSSGIIKCIIPSKIYIEGIGIKTNIIVGFINKNFYIDGVNCILNGGIKC